MITAEQVKELRDATGIGVSECKKALEESGGDMQKARDILLRRAGAAAQKKIGRALGAGVVAAYVHNTGQVGAMVLLSCETDFVSKNEEFVELAKNIAMHVAAMKPSDAQSLLAEAYIKDSGRTIADLVAAAAQKFGERVEITEFSCFSVK